MMIIMAQKARFQNISNNSAIMASKTENVCQPVGRKQTETFCTQKLVFAIKICTGCRIVKYCNRECLVAHRKSHKKACNSAQERAFLNAAAATAPAGSSSTSAYGAWVDPEDLSDDLKNMTVIDWIADRFLHLLMIPILGTDYDDPCMWNMLYKKGAKKRIHTHMVNSFFEKYFCTHPEYQSKSAIDGLASLKWGATMNIDQEPIFRPMQVELYRYLKTEGGSYDWGE